jgi:predicted RNase H-like HicB family nuclease
MLPPLNIQIVIWKEEDMYVAESPLLGVVSQGDTIRGALENVKEAIELYLEDPDVQRHILSNQRLLRVPRININITPAQENVERGWWLNEQITSPLWG